MISKSAFSTMTENSFPLGVSVGAFVGSQFVRHFCKTVVHIAAFVIHDMPIFRIFIEFYNSINAPFHIITQFGLHAFQISALALYHRICFKSSVTIRLSSEKSTDQTALFVVVIITKTVSSCDIVIFLFKDGWIENRNPFSLSR